MSNTRNTTAGIAAEIAKGWQPNNYLTNMSMAYFQKPEDYVAHSISRSARCSCPLPTTTRSARKIWPATTCSLSPLSARLTLL